MTANFDTEGIDMKFQRARNAAQKENRRQEILEAARELFAEGGFENVTFTQIADRTSFTRQAIYQYHTTREEILLDLLRLKVEEFNADLTNLFDGVAELSQEIFAERLASLLWQHSEMLELLAANRSFSPENVRFEKLVEFNRSFIGIAKTLDEIILKFFPRNDRKRRFMFEFALFTYISAMIPVLKPPPVQIKAIQAVDKDFEYPPPFETTRLAIMMITSQLNFAPPEK